MKITRRSAILRIVTVVVAVFVVAKPAAAIDLLPNGSRRAQALGPIVHVAPWGDDQAAGDAQSPLRTIQTAADRAAPGTIIELRGGNYNESVHVYAKALHFRSAPGELAVLDGAVKVGDWTQGLGGSWFHDDWQVDLVRQATDVVDPAAPEAALPDQVFIDGAPLRQVTSLRDLAPGTFFYDPDSQRHWIGDDPAGRVVEASNLPWGFYLNEAHGSSLIGIAVRRYGTAAPQMAAVRAYGDDIAIADALVELNAYAGVSAIGDRITIERSTMRSNGHLGVHGHHANSLRLTDSVVTKNNRERFDPLHSAGGVKVTTSKGIRIQNNYVAENRGPGIWTDLAVSEAEIIGNLVERNSRSGVEIELSGRVIVADNVSLDNGETGIWVLESNDVEVWNNAAFGNERQIWIEDGPRTGDTSDPAVAWNLERVTVHNNTLGRSSSDRALLAVDDWTERRSALDMAVVSDANAYWLPPSPTGRTLVRWVNWPAPASVSATLVEHRQATGADTTSVMSASTVNPYAGDPQGYDFRVPAGIATGIVPSDAAADALQIARGRLVGIGPLTISRPIDTTIDPSLDVSPTAAARPEPAQNRLPVTVIIESARVLDTRPEGVTIDNTYTNIGPWPGGSTFAVPVQGRGVPLEATTAASTLTVVGANEPGFATLYPCGTARPETPTVIYSAQDATSDLITVDLAADDGRVCIFTSSTAHLILDISGYT